VSLERLAELLRERNRISTEIAALIGRLALNSHVGEYIASQVFDIELYDKENLEQNTCALACPEIGVKWF
jgi:hypothetical protein